ncbi:hypothetical protein COOONC_03608 [Cooperia oncophora]
MVDLAGSERQSQAPTVGNRFKEAVNINLSLSVLGRVIRTLSAANRRGEFIPYRESKLTHILRDSLGGKQYYSDTLSTLQFAAACRKIENRVHANEDLTGDTVMAYKKMAAKVTAIEDDLRLWKETAISREKQLVEALLQRDLFAAQLTRKPSGDGDVKSQDDIVRDMASQISKRIDSVKTFEELTRAQLESDLFRAQCELDQMRLRLESAEGATKALNEKYSNVLEGFDKSLAGSPLRTINLNTSPRIDNGCKTPAQLKKERRMAMFTPQRNNQSVLFDDSEDADALDGNIEQYAILEQREVLRLKTDNNRLSQTVSEKEAKIKEISEMQRIEAQQWIEEREKFHKTESSLKSQIDRLEMEKSQLTENLAQIQQRTDMLSAKIFSFNDEKCSLLQEIDELRSEKLSLEDRLQASQNEQEELSIKLKSMDDLVLSFNVLMGFHIVSSNTDIEKRLYDEQIKHNSLKVGLQPICWYWRKGMS